MIEYIKKLAKFSATTGLFLPSAYDARTKHGSISLLFAHISFYVSVAGIIALLLTNLQMGVYCAMAFSVLMLAFYLIRSLDKVKVGKDGLELDGNDPQPTEEKHG